MKKIFFIFYFVVSLGFLVVPVFSQAASVAWYKVNDDTVALILDTEGQKINTIEGELGISTDLKIKNISDANSLINFWIEKPVIKGGLITFAGIVPGGYQGQGIILSLKLDNSNLNTKNFNNQVWVKSFSALLNDGSGQSAKVKINGLLSDPNITKQLEEVSNNLSYPEIFLPQIVKSSSLPSEDYYLVFGTQDKSSGLAYYAVYESAWPVFNIAKNNQSLAWIKTDSPYKLKKQNLRGYIYVKAVNHNGNVRIMRLSPQFSLGWLYEHWFISLIIIIAICLGFTFIRRV